MPLAPIAFAEADAQALAAHQGRVIAFADTDPDTWARRIDRLTKGAMASAPWPAPHGKSSSPARGWSWPFPPGMAARAVHLICLPKRAKAEGVL
jgi:leucyl aminopeptidase